MRIAAAPLTRVRHPLVGNDTDKGGDHGFGDEGGGEPVNHSGRVGEVAGGGRDRGRDSDPEGGPDFVSGHEEA
jgi:hypothetical protein